MIKDSVSLNCELNDLQQNQWICVVRFEPEAPDVESNKSVPQSLPNCIFVL